MDFCVSEGVEREIEKGCKVANARCSPKRDHLAPTFSHIFCKLFYYKINCSFFRLCGRNEQRSTLTSMVEFAVSGLQNPAGAYSPDAFLLLGRVTPMHIQSRTVKPIQVKLPPPCQPYLQGTRPFGRSYYSVPS
jgi:hypothetical protein